MTLITKPLLVLRNGPKNSALKILTPQNWLYRFKLTLPLEGHPWSLGWQKNLELKKAMENHHSFQYQVSSTNMLNMCMLRWSDSLEKSWFEVITYSHNCYHNSDLWRRAGLHNVCCLGKNGAIRSSSKHPSNKSSTGSTLSVARWLFFGCATKKNKEVHSGPKTPCGTHGTRLLQLVVFHAQKTGQRWDDNNKNTRILNAQKVAWTTCLQQIYLYVQVYLQFTIWPFPFNPCPDGKVWLEVWFGGMIRGYDSGYDSRVWFAAPKTFISALAGNWALSLSFTGPAHYQLN